MKAIVVFLLLISTATAADKIVVRIEHGGFAGLNGGQFTFTPDNKWKEEDFFPDRFPKPEQIQLRRHGWSRDVWKKLNESFDKNQFDALPDKIGQEPKVNAEHIVLIRGKKRVCISVNMGVDPIPKAYSTDMKKSRSAGTKEWTRATSIVGDIEDNSVLGWIK